MMKKAFEQTIKHVQGSSALVESRKGNIYPVIVSDFVRIKKFRELQVGAIGLVKRVNGKFYLVDVKPKEPTKPSYMEEIPLEELGYDY